MKLTPSQFRAFMFLGGSAITIVAILVSQVFVLPLVSGGMIGLLGMLLDRAFPKGIGGYSFSIYALVIGGASLGYFAFKSLSPETTQTALWSYMLQYIGLLYTTWGIFLFLFPWKENAL